MGRLICYFSANEREPSPVTYLRGNGSAPSGDFLTAIAQVASGLVA